MALKLATVVVDATESGAVPVGIVDAKALVLNTPEAGTKVSFVPAVLCPQFPEVFVTKVG